MNSGIDLAAAQNIVDVLGNALPSIEPSIDQVFTLDNIAPQTDSVVVDGGQNSVVRSISIRFDSIVTIDANSFEVTTDSGSPVTVHSVSAIVGGKTQTVLTFSGSMVDPSSSLLDGIYRLTIRDTHVRDAAGNALDGDRDGTAGAPLVDEFFRLFGDTDGDRDVDGQDYGRFGLSFLKRTGEDGFNPALDSDGDGDVDGQDYGRFGRNFLRRI